MQCNLIKRARQRPNSKLMRLAAIGVILVLANHSGAQSGAQARQDQTPSAQPYKSPYSLAFTVPLQNLLAADSEAPRDDPHKQSSTDYGQWYSADTKARFGSWGPEPRHYPAISAGRSGQDPAWMRQRLLAVGQNLIGLPYQHHHLPNWDPPADWPWKEVALGHQSVGMDCSDFTSWLYNYGFGIKLITNVHKQAESLDLPGPGGEGRIAAQLITNDGDYNALLKKLCSGDLLYIRKNTGEISHVIVWVGDIGRSPDGLPLVMDCTDMSRKDANGATIPTGVNLRPFTADSWYFKNLSHAHRIIGCPTVPL